MTKQERATAMRAMRDNGASTREIGAAFGISHQAVAKSLAREVSDDEKPDVMATDLVRGRRGRRTQRAVTINVNRLSKRELERGRMESPPAETTDLYDRPKTRGDCLQGENAQRPCPWIGCTRHAFVDVDRSTGSIKVNHVPADDSAEALVEVLRAMPYTCTLDLADEGGATLERAASVLGIVRERLRQLEVIALDKVLRTAIRAGADDYLDEDVASLSVVANALDTLPRVVRVLPTQPPAQERPTLDAEGRAIAALGMVATNPRRIVQRSGK